MTDTSDLKVLFLDIDDTLFGTTDFVQKARAAAVDAMIERGLRADKERVLKSLAAVVAEFGSNDDHHYNRLLQRMPASCTSGANHDLLVGAGVIAYHNTKWEELRIKPEAEQLLRDLAATPLRLGVISAGLVHKQVEKVLRLGIDRYLDKDLLFITHAVGIAKSNPRLYERCIEHAGVAAGQAMHVGDHPYHDVDAANAAGLRTVWLRGSGKYSTLKPQSEPDHVIDEFVELRALLRENYDLAV
ncbi:MAG: HAD-IA family hydrolase [Planctomycetes bacterium]|nr:HAD-IA family hydrolase [Planctomycetota bacterium]MCP4772126.1 HAD-IA family hydrolase [Planctomycetota bacterium]MCP4861413.1 HAD-IA family hydrolase [Planctomycetota bacterium]